jgi:uncharacterized protein YjbK
MTKQELETKVQELELTLNSLELNAKTVKDDLTETNSRLENINKPVINDLTVDKLYEVISRSFEDFDPNDYAPNYDFELDYDGRVSVTHIELESLDMFAEQIHDRILREFNVINEENV